MNQSAAKQFTIDEVVPHKATMSLLDELVDNGDDWIKTKLTITPNSVFVTEKGVPSWIGIEYMAQSVAAFAGLRRRLDGKEAIIGFLVGMRKYTCSHSYFPVGAELTVTAKSDFESDNGLGAFQCTISGEFTSEDVKEKIEADSMVNVFQPNDAEEFLANSF